MCRFAGAAAIDLMLLHWSTANGALRVFLHNIRRFVSSTELRGTLELIEESAPCCPETWLAIPTSVMPEAALSIAHSS